MQTSNPQVWQYKNGNFLYVKHDLRKYHEESLQTGDNLDWNGTRHCTRANGNLHSSEIQKSTFNKNQHFHRREFLHMHQHIYRSSILLSLYPWSPRKRNYPSAGIQLPGNSGNCPEPAQTKRNNPTICCPVNATSLPQHSQAIGDACYGDAGGSVWKFANFRCSHFKGLYKTPSSEIN